LHQEALQPNVPVSGAPLSWRFLILLIPVGIGAGIGAGLLMWLLRAVEHFFWSYRTGDFLTAVEHADAAERIGILLLAGVLAGVADWLIKRQPGGGTDLSEAVWFRYGRLPFRQAIERAVLSIVIVGMGASLGREAAPKMTGAAIANAFSSWARLSDAERRILVACGAGAGMGAVYNVPFGGALFTLEILLGTLALPLAVPAILTSLTATWVSWFFIPNEPTYVIPAYDSVSAAQIVWAIGAGPLAGLAASVYVRAISWADSCRPQGWRALFLPVAIFTALGLLALPFPQLLGNGKDTVFRAFLGEFSLPLLLALFFLKPLATSACLASGAPGGLFTPTLTCGAMLGGALGWVWTMLWPGAPIGSYAIIGAGALLAAATQSPIAAIVLMLELAPGTTRLAVPLMLAVAGAVFVAGLLETRSIYSGRVHHLRRTK